jgi:hypothetical protein
MVVWRDGATIARELHHLVPSPWSSTPLHFTQLIMSNHFTVRSLMPSPGLEGAFRVHIHAGDLTRLGLKLGDVCLITSEDGSTSGLGIAWRAAEKLGTNPKMQPVQLSETLRETFGFKIGSHVKIEKSAKTISPAAKVEVTEITPSDYDGTDDMQWDIRCRYWLCMYAPRRMWLLIDRRLTSTSSRQV